MLPGPLLRKFRPMIGLNVFGYSGDSRLKQLTIEQRLRFLLRAGFFLCLGSAFTGFLFSLLYFSTTAFKDELRSLSRVAGAASRAALAFSDQQSGLRIIKALSERDSIRYAALIHTDGALLAEAGYAPHTVLTSPGTDWSWDSLSVRQPVMLDGEQIGSIVVVSDLGSLYQQLLWLIVLCVGVVLFSLYLAAKISGKLNQWVSSPLVLLKDLTDKISQTKDLTSRLKADGTDEIHQLFTAFNAMLAQLEDRNRELVLARNHAERAAQVKSMFLATVSHELRTPIHAILGMTDEVLAMEESAEKRDLLEIVKSAGKSLLFVINDILDFSAIESGQLRLSPAEFELEDFLRRVLQMFSISAQRKHLQLRLRIDPDVPARVIADSGRLSQILVNLIGNAIKFTPAGSIELWVSRVEFIPKNNSVMLMFVVSDTGIGISEDSLAVVFDAFTKIRKEGDNTEGTGLGLAITAKLVSLMAGQISVESRAGEGTKMIFSLECVLPTKQVDRVISAIELSPSVSVARTDEPFTILVAEDNNVNRQLAQRMLERSGFRVLLAVNGEECVAVYREKHVDAILMDVDMPVMDGVQATREIRKLEMRGEKRIPIIAFTASTGPEGITLCLESGMDAYLPKPVDKQTLLETLRRFFDDTIALPKAN